MRISLIIEKGNENANLLPSVCWRTLICMTISICLDHIVNSSCIFDRIRCIIHDHVRCFARCVDMDISESKECLEHSSGIGIYFLYSIKAAFGDASRKSRNLLDPYDPWIGDDKQIELIVDPIKEDKGQKCYPINGDTRPVDSLISQQFDNGSLIRDKYPRRYNKSDKVEKVVDEYYPMSMEGHYDLFVIFEEGYVFFFDHVMCGSLR